MREKNSVEDTSKLIEDLEVNFDDSNKNMHKKLKPKRNKSASTEETNKINEYLEQEKDEGN